MLAKVNRYCQLIESIFLKSYKDGFQEVVFERDDLVQTAAQLKIELPKNLGDVVYSFRYRANLPKAISDTAPEGHEWVIRPIGKGIYKFSLSNMPRILPSANYSETKIPDATPGIIVKYAFEDEQSLLAKLRYNRLVDIFTGITCYSLQNHLRTTVPGMGQIETDEVYVGLDKQGVHYIIPVQAKGGSDQLGIIQIEQDFAMCEKKFPGLICIPIAAQFIDATLIAIFSFELGDNGVAIGSEKHYRLVEPGSLTKEELEQYKRRVN